MKKRSTCLKKLTLCLVLANASLLAFYGCATPQTTPGAPAVLAPVVTPAQPAQAVPQVTPAVPATATTPAIPPVTNYVYLPATPPVTNYVTITAAGPPVVTNYLPNQTVISAANYANAAAPLVPAPYGTILTGLASLAALVAGYVAQKKNTQLAAASDSADTHAAAAAAMASVIQATPTLVTQAMIAAQTNGSTAAVATHIASAGSPT